MNRILNLPHHISPLPVIALFFCNDNQAPDAKIKLNPFNTCVICVLVLGITGYFIRRLIRKPESDTTASQRDLIDLLTNKPWLMILGLGFLTMMFNGIKYGVIAYYFTHYVGKATLAGWYFIVLLLISIFAALVA